MWDQFSRSARNISDTTMDLVAARRHQQKCEGINICGGGAGRQTRRLAALAVFGRRSLNWRKTFDEPGHKNCVKTSARITILFIGVTALRRCANLSTGFRPHSQVGASGTMSKQQ